MLRLLLLGEAGKTEIMYTISMSYHQLRSYLDWLLKLGLMERVAEESGAARYRITHKGLSLLTKIENVEEMLKLDEVPEILHAPELTRDIGSKPYIRSRRFRKV